jgi:hypothetical protein
LGTGSVLLSLQSNNWNPSEANNYLSLSWDYDGSYIAPGEIRKIVLTLSASQDCPLYNSFQFDVTINLS